MLTAVAFSLAAVVWLYMVFDTRRHPDPRPLVRWPTLALLAAAPVVALIGLLIIRHS